MAKKSMIVKANRPQKFKVREYTRCARCGRPHAVMSKFGICRICFRELAYKGQIPLRNQVGNWKGGVYYGSSNRYNCRYVNSYS